MKIMKILLNQITLQMIMILFLRIIIIQPKRKKKLKEGNIYLITSMIEQLKETLVDCDDFGDTQVKEIMLNTLREIDEDLDCKIKNNENEGKKKG